MLLRAFLGHVILAGKYFANIHLFNSLLSSRLVRVLPWPNKDYVPDPRWSEHGCVFDLCSIILVVD
jgi:hypothetical protein